MSNITYCERCGAEHYWRWEEAFDKFGFEDGDGQVMTDTVVEALCKAGYTVAAEPWGFHNVVITSIKRDGSELIPAGSEIGYDAPRDYLPADIIDLLDEKLGDTDVRAAVPPHQPRKDQTMTSADITNTAIEANLSALADGLQHAAKLASQAREAIQTGYRYVAIGTMLPLEQELPASIGLLTAILALHRRAGQGGAP